MSIWTDIHKRSNGTSIRKEDQVIPEKHKNLQDNVPRSRTKWYYDSGSGDIFKKYVSGLDELLDNLDNL